MKFSVGGVAATLLLLAAMGVEAKEGKSPPAASPPKKAAPASPKEPSYKPHSSYGASPAKSKYSRDVDDAYGESAYGSSKKKYSLDDDTEKGGYVSKACRYDKAEWSDCDPFQLTRYRVLHLITGGRQCEESKNMTKHCTPDEYPTGTKWLISEHRKCIAELKRIKAMIADLSKYIETLHPKGKALLNSYTSLKKHLDELKGQIDTLKRQGVQQKSHLTSLRAQIEEWKAKARDLQTELDDLKTKYHDLQVEHKEMGEKLKECRAENRRGVQENMRLKKKIHDLQMESAELKRRLLDAEKYKEVLREAKYSIGKLEYKVEKLQDQLEKVKDDMAQCKLDLLNAKNYQETIYNKDTHVDLNMDMWITHNKSKVFYSTQHYTYPTTYKPRDLHYEAPQDQGPKCLITYYGYTNETCWYESRGDSAESGYADTLGHHLVEAHWKYFTIGVKDAYECDKATKLHYEFLLKRCSPKHYLPVLSVFRPNAAAKELTSHIYPKPNIPQPGGRMRCWITFLGPHGKCESHMDHYNHYNTDDTPEGYKQGSGTSRQKCLSRKANWQTYCHTPVLVTYLPEGISTNWHKDDIQHDSHGGRMFERAGSVISKINPESMNPNYVKRPKYKPQEQYQDTPEYRQSLNMKGSEREAILAQLRKRLGLTQSTIVKGYNQNKIKWHESQTEVVKAKKPNLPAKPAQASAPTYNPDKHAPPPAAAVPEVGSHSPKYKAHSYTPDNHPSSYVKPVSNYNSKPAVSHSYSPAPVKTSAPAPVAQVSHSYGKPAPVPHKPAPAPYKPVPAPHKPAPAPYKPAPAPHKPAPAPYNPPSASPHKPAPAPHKTAPTPVPAPHKPVPGKSGVAPIKTVYAAH